MKKWFILLFLIPLFGIAQLKYIPRNFEDAVKHKTRTFKGVPGLHYWQNRSYYTIDVNLDPKTNMVSGREKIEYQNLSPDSLNFLVFRLYQNVNKIGNARDWTVGEKNVSQGILLHKLIVGKDTINLEKPPKGFRYSATNLYVPLTEKLAPGKNLAIEVEWEFQVPDSIQIRMGKYKTGAFFIAYWYPQIAVYDDVDGWDRNEYYGTVEFYNDFNDYDVTISVPANYYVWASGELQNENNVYSEKILKRLQQARKMDSTFHILTSEDWHLKDVQEIKQWKFKAKNVTDFAFVVAKNYHWDATSTIVDKQTGRRTLISVLYPDSVPHYSTVLPYVRKILHYYSTELPGVPYPYSHTTNFCNGNRGGGMEFPMLTNDGAPTKKNSLIGLLAHEIAHTYFPFYMGINERKYAWMDEGWATFLTSAFMTTIDTSRTVMGSLSGRYKRMAGTEYDVPLAVPTTLTRSNAYRFEAYSRSSMSYSILHCALGKKKFQRALQEYIHIWHGKHPIPTDFFFSMEKASGEDLSWIWNTWFYGFGYPDLALTNVKVKKNRAEVEVKKVGLLPIPVKINILYADSSRESVMKPISVWKNGEKELKIKFPLKKKVLDIWLDDKTVPDAVSANNRIPFKK